MARTYAPYGFGYRTLSETLSHLATSQPDRIYASIPKTANLVDGFLDVSVSDMERMASALTGWIEDTWGQSSSFETIAYIGIPDLRSVPVFLAALFLPSPRNAMAANVSLLEKTGCSKIIYAKEVKPVIDQICNLTTALAIEVSSFDEIFRMPLRGTFFPKRPFDKVKNDPILILHSSGSTGLPKPITMTNGTFGVLDSERFLPDVPGRVRRDFSIWDFEGGGKFFTIFPYFHLAGFLSLVVNPIFTEASSPVLGPPLAPPSGALMKEVLKHQKVKALYIPPSIAEQMLAESDGIDYFERLDFICYTGGPFSPDAGLRLVQVTDLVPLYGSTEAFQTPQLVPSKEDWAYMEWNPHFKHVMELAEDGAYELVLFTDASTEKRSALNHNFPGTPEWRTRDLFKPHPSKPNLWQYYGRRDDIIVFSNGEKFNPVPMELMIGGNKSLSGVLVVGQGRLQASLLLEPIPGNAHDSAKFIEDLLPLVGRANAQAPAQGRISRSKILVVAPGAFIRAGKGTVIRKLSEKKLQAEIDKLYLSDVETFAGDIVADAFSKRLHLHDDFFAFGLDSLNTAFFIGFPFVAIVVNIPQRAQAVYGLSPTHAGLALLPLLLTSPFATALSGFLTSNMKVPPLYLILIGAVLQVGRCGVDMFAAYESRGRDPGKAVWV
ncbi:hypothetical protein G7Y89_g10678 [Cudoniella acicularis]|uniref:AMP-dependent synthetase/ligase domain-containing protein n=1 Tax=Cudoniella acicularis TaxID=354080 RepID=A0A8H4VYZ6_9HELO|nr:hypothetical protein G7Y89_g10678 [Cudoniella acicularis]